MLGPLLYQYEEVVFVKRVIFIKVTMKRSACLRDLITMWSLYGGGLCKKVVFKR